MFTFKLESASHPEFCFAIDRGQRGVSCKYLSGAKNLNLPPWLLQSRGSFPSHRDTPVSQVTSAEFRTRMSSRDMGWP